MACTPTPSSPDGFSSSPLSSPLSSLGSRSPSPPADYPSPLSSNISEAGFSSPSKRRSPGDVEDDSQPPVKKQKSQPKERTTEYLNLSALNESSDGKDHADHDAKLRKLTEVLRSKKKIVVVAGAGISCSAGIPDFRSSKGLFTTLKSQHKSAKSSGKHLFDASVYSSDNATEDFHAMVRKLSHLTQKAEPTAFHHMLATLAQEGRLLRLYTQNVDGIDTAIKPLATNVPLNKKGPWPKTIQLHGGLDKMVCSSAGHLANFDGALFDGPEAPLCPDCKEVEGVREIAGFRPRGVGCLRPRMVLYNEYNPDEEAIGAVSAADLKSRPDAVIVVGTSLKVPGIRRLVKEMCAVTRGRRGGFTAWINLDPEPLGVDFKDSWDLVVQGKSDDVAHHVGLPKWDDTDFGEFQVVPREEVKQKGEFEIVLDSKPLQTGNAEDSSKTKQGILSFANKPVAKELKPKKPPTKRVRKPKTAPSQVKPNIKNNFPIGKPIGKNKVLQQPRKEESGKPSNRASSPDARLKTVPPTDWRTNSESQKVLSHDLEIAKALPSENPDHSAKACDMDLTVFPPSIPSGMKNMLS